MRNWRVEHNRLEFAEFYAAARDDCLRVVLVRVADRQLAEDAAVRAGRWRGWDGGEGGWPCRGA